MIDNISLNIAVSFYKIVQTQKKKEFKGILEELELFSKMIENDSKFLKLMKSPCINNFEKKAILNKTVANDFLKQLFFLLVKVKRFDQVGHISKIFHTLFEIDNKEVNVELIFAQDVSQEQAKKVSDVVSKYLDKKINVSKNIQDELIGGIVVKINNKILDYSIFNELKVIKERLVNCEIR